MINENNIRITITISKKQNNWLNKFCKEHGLTTSKYIRWLLSKKTVELTKYKISKKVKSIAPSLFNDEKLINKQEENEEPWNILEELNLKKEESWEEILKDL